MAYITVDEPSNLNDLVDYHHYVSTWKNTDFHIALTRTGEIKAWGTADEAAFNVPYGTGYNNLIATAYYDGLCFMVLDGTGFLVGWQTVAVDVWTTPPFNTDYLPKPRYAFVKLKYISSEHKLIAIRSDGASIIYHNGIDYRSDDLDRSTDYLDYSEYEYNINDNITDANVAILGYDKSLEKSVEDLFEQALISLQTKVIRTTKIKFVNAARLQCMPKFSDIGSTLSTYSILEVAGGTYVYGQGLLYGSIAKLIIGKTPAVFISGDARLVLKTTLEIEPLELSAKASLLIKASSLACVARNWDLLEQIRESLGISSCSYLHN